ncbi:TetR/AcrR family transcriptional regulator [Microbacterium amylolyticum]|uniref:AcrR family transcriptional regulator n=1 Tax=Microbacterium amylolyticum TaxID=936337 RepID=A0ABS4ZGN7_9MICO|nr:TetR family transcriptional regulator C-terminal domain-containing protein [Microbacterium amylolyticum]MBP2436218.1 AcrR family transcriptional regulator [Microbacterium amylolyticum]
MPREIDQQQRDRQIVEAAWEVIAREGVAALSVRRVAAEAGLSAGSLRYSFPSQAALRERAVETLIERLSSRIAALDTSLAPRVWARAVLLELLPLDQQRCIEMEVGIALGIAAKADSGLHPLRRRLDDEIRRTCDSAARMLGHDDPRDIDMLHGIVDGLALHLVAQEPGTSADWAIAVIDRWLESAAGQG